MEYVKQATALKFFVEQVQKTPKFPLRLDLQFFSDGGSPEDNPDNNPGDPTNLPKSQEELDELVKKRLERERKKAAEKYGDYDDVKAKLAEYEKGEEERKKQEMTEIERLQAEKEEADKKAIEASEAAQKAQEKANTRILNTEIKSMARALDANDPGDVLALLDKSTIQLDENGNYQGVEEAVTALKESKPWMFKKVVGADAAGGANPGTNPRANEILALEKELEEAKTKALKDSKFAGEVTRIYNKLLEAKSKK
ncbi:phage scaffolding protein [Bacillus thuringiensis]|uniref:phage scaffolding protein n=1 Tax=Bacillus thuringiensis TaxID=1428 RepID=UPI0021564387|nr:phage scaffolding protein [Bacillus thuringiensis]MEC2470361.1 phage scaffolding protein [Bacillus thuringiensis]MEC3222321.1 phage scaffolding protein [Bacillus thuringiensis]MEC3462827.1 phage scaffolding protein [Bacillus thuringiensis]MEC3553908.1 phage scaffolding protein [Bacillus thuringiensis]MED1827047.1 phage scaffolding protein [Bacillus thuringiensis]